MPGKGVVLTSTFRLRTNPHDQMRLRTALRRWHHSFQTSIDQARGRQAELLRCLELWTGKKDDAEVTKLVVNGDRLKAFVKSVTHKPTGLHSACHASLLVSVGELLASYLGLYALWVNQKRKGVKPSFPRVAPATAKAAQERWEAALDASGQVGTLSEEAEWRAEVTRAAKGSRLPMYFGAATSGMGGQSHCGLLRREDGKLFALLTLWPAGDPLGEPVVRARNRTARGAVRNVVDTAGRLETKHIRACRKAAKAEKDAPVSPEWNPRNFTPTVRARASIMCPLEFERGHEKLFMQRAEPRSANLIEKPDGFYLHVAFQFPEPPTRALGTGLLAIKRGVTSLISWSLMDAQGQEQECGVVDGRDLSRLVTEQGRVRAIRQAKGRTTAGDRRVSRVVEHHLYSAGHQLIDRACKAGVGLVLLDDAQDRKPKRWLAYRHWSQLAEILAQLAQEAGLPAPQLLKIYGSPFTCMHCGWKPDDRLAQPKEVEHGCLKCGTLRDKEYHLARLVGFEALRRRSAKSGKYGSLGDWIKAIRSA